MGNIKKSVLITVTGRQSAAGPGEAPEETVLTTGGTFYRQGGGYYIAYEESAATGLEGTQTLISVRKGSAVMSRRGRYPCRMSFEPGKARTDIYTTAYGRLELTVFTHSLICSLTDGGGRLEVRYDLSAEGSFISANSLDIKITERKQ